MIRAIFITLVFMLGLSACTENTQKLAADGKPLPKLYRISSRDTAKIQYRILDAVNTLRSASNTNTVAFNARLNAAAATHSRDMHVQNRPWHFGSDGSSPIDRVARAGYSGLMLGENISETYETELETLSAWMEQEDTRNIILDTRATGLGFSWYQDDKGKIWWTLLMGGSETVIAAAQ